MPEIKIFHKHKQGYLVLTEEDIILFRNSKFSLVTQTYIFNSRECCYELPRNICESLIRVGKLVMVKRDKDNGDFYKIG